MFKAIYITKQELETNYYQPSISNSSKSGIHPPAGFKYIFLNSRKFPKAKLEFAICQQLFTSHLYCIYNYWHGIYIVLGVISNLEMI